MRTKIKRGSILVLSVLILSCSVIPEDVKITLNAAEDNKEQLEKVINHYKCLGEKEKVKAAYFLIGNMDNKYALGGEDLKKYDSIFKFYKGLRDKKLQITAASVYFNTKLDSFVSVFGPFNKRDKEVIPDFKFIKAENLIKDIDNAFAIKDSTPWGRKISFEDFCEHLLSYRFNHEPLEDWRSVYRDKYSGMTDTLKKDSVKHLVEAIHKYTPRISGSNFFMKYPFDFWIEQMEASRAGTCVQIATYRAQLFRAAGIPTAIDFTMCWGNHSAEHTWNTIMTEDGKNIHYEGTALQFGQELVYKVAKVYRKTYGRQETGYGKHENEIPPSVRNDHIIDVTSEYTKTTDISVPLKYEPTSRKRYAVICSHNNKVWVPQDYGKISSGKARFKSMGTGNLYNVMYHEDGALKPASDPFILNEKGEVVFITPASDKTQDMHLLRKYPMRKSIKAYHDGLVGCHFQGANSSDFRDSVILHTITSSPNHIIPVNITNPKKIPVCTF